MAVLGKSVSNLLFDELLVQYMATKIDTGLNKAVTMQSTLILQMAQLRPSMRVGLPKVAQLALPAREPDPRVRASA